MKTTQPRSSLVVDLVAQARAVRDAEETVIEVSPGNFRADRDTSSSEVSPGNFRADGGTNSSEVSPGNFSRGGLRAFFAPISGARRVGLVALAAIRTRPEGQVRSGSPTSDEDFADLVASVRAQGVLQPVTLTWDEAADCFWIEFGHRRVAAARAAGVTAIPAVVRLAAGGETSGAVMTQQQLIENLQRTNLPPIDVAHALKRLVDAGTSAVDVATSIGKSKSWVSKHLRLLDLSPEVLARAEELGVGGSSLYAIARAETGDGEASALLDVAAREGRDTLAKRTRRRPRATVTRTDEESSPIEPTSAAPADATSQVVATRAIAQQTMSTLREFAQVISNADDSPALAAKATALATEIEEWDRSLQSATRGVT